MREGDRIKVIGVADTPYSERLVGRFGAVEGISPGTVNVKLDEGYLMSLPHKDVEVAYPDIDKLHKLDEWMDDWCCSCPLLGDEVCENCIIRYLDAWMEEKRVRCDRN